MLGMERFTRLVNVWCFVVLASTLVRAQQSAITLLNLAKLPENSTIPISTSFNVTWITSVTIKNPALRIENVGTDYIGQDIWYPGESPANVTMAEEITIDRRWAGVQVTIFLYDQDGSSFAYSDVPAASNVLNIVSRESNSTLPSALTDPLPDGAIYQYGGEAAWEYADSTTYVEVSTVASRVTIGAAKATSSSTPASASASATATSSSSASASPSSSSSGLSTGAKAGIGVGVTLGVIFLLGAAFAFWRFNKSRKSQSGSAPGAAEAELAGDSAAVRHEKSGNEISSKVAPTELEGAQNEKPMELESRQNERPVELEGSAPQNDRPDE